MARKRVRPPLEPSFSAPRFIHPHFHQASCSHCSILSLAQLTLLTQQCDEAHPACRNCQKSKRDCLGYDPIFKAQPGPTNIQPAPIAATTMQAHTEPGPSYHPPPQGYMPAGTQPYAPSLSAGVNSPRSSTEPYHNDYGAAIDPALKGVGNSSVHNPQGTFDSIP